MLNVVRNKTVVITGGGTGLGKALAIECLFQKANVVIIGRRKEVLKQVIEEISQIRKRTGKINYIQGDISTVNGCEKIIHTVRRTFGGIDLLINNAAVFFGGPLDEQKPSDVKRMIDTNLSGHILMTVLGLEDLLSNRRSGIINIISYAGIVGIPYMSVYSATKFGMVGFSQGLRREYGSKLTVLNVFPTALKTGLMGDAVKKLEKLAFDPVAAPDAAKLIIDAYKEGKNELRIGKQAKSWPWKSIAFPKSIDKLIAKIKSKLLAALGGVSSENGKIFDRKSNL